MAKKPVKDENKLYAVIFNVTNKLGVNLTLSRFSCAFKMDYVYHRDYEYHPTANYKGPHILPSGKKTQVIFNDLDFVLGADATAVFVAEVDGQLREYTWWGYCPDSWVHFGDSNNAKGPGVPKKIPHGSPLILDITIDKKTSGWKVGKKIHHIFVLMLENRSFDHMLGFSEISGVDAETGEQTKINGLTGTESNKYKDKEYKVKNGAPQTLPHDPTHSFPSVVKQLAGIDASYKPRGAYPPINNSGFAADYGTARHAKDPGDVMKCFSPGQLPVLTSLAKEYAVCDAWYSSLPGPTWPNRFFMMAGSSGGLDRGPTSAEIKRWFTIDGYAFQHGSLFDAVRKANKKSRIYGGRRGHVSGYTPIACALKGINPLPSEYFRTGDNHPYELDFWRDLSFGSIGEFNLIEPSYGEIIPNETYRGGNSQHLFDGVAGGEALIKDCYEKLRHSPQWGSSLLIVTWDEHGGFYDHVEPPKTVPPGDVSKQKGVNKSGFRFDQLGVRVPAVVVSPWIKKNTVDHRVYEQASIPATVEKLLGFKPLTKRDKAARDLSSLLELSMPRQDTLQKLPEPEKLDPQVLRDLGTSIETLPLDEGNLVGFLFIAARCDIALSDGANLQSVIKLLDSIQNRSDAADYIKEVAERLYR